MPRTKIEIPPSIISDSSEANDTLGQIAALKRDLTLIETGLNESIDALKAKAEIEAQPLKFEIKKLETALEAFASCNKTELFKGKRSLEFAHGVISWRKSSEIKPMAKWTVPQIMGRIKALELHEAIRTKEELDKDKMRTWPAEKLELVGARLVEKDVFGYERKREDMEAAA